MDLTRSKFKSVEIEKLAVVLDKLHEIVAPTIVTSVSDSATCHLMKRMYETTQLVAALSNHFNDYQGWSSRSKSPKMVVVKWKVRKLTKQPLSAASVSSIKSLRLIDRLVSGVTSLKLSTNFLALAISQLVQMAYTQSTDNWH
ncbi:hypothetical protein FQR65_LT08323 [Abscondita terminalis]|nr:hypothetical protein FQR65_LT08323 [Abscondita terminalis]